MMIVGTHNSGTYAKLVWWQRPLGCLINLFSRCQSKTIDEQLKDGIKYFNIQLTFYKNDWYFSHGLALYNLKFWDIFDKFVKKATKRKPIYLQLYLDKNFFFTQNKEKFKQFIRIVEREIEGTNVKISRVWIEGSDKWDIRDNLKCIDKYWGLWWIKKDPNFKWYEKLPFPICHAKRYNKKYKEQIKSGELNNYDVVLLDFYHLI